MERTLIVGLQFGDEGKGRVSEFYGRDVDWFVKFNGGNNSGHTVYQDGIKYALHHLPAGAVMNKKVALDCGMLIEPNAFYEECRNSGINPDNLWVSEQCHIIRPKHLELDSKGSGIGTTRKGIAYAYSDKALRQGTQFGQYLKETAWTADFLGRPLQTYRGMPPIQPNESAVYEGGQAVMLDVNYGRYPNVTSSSVFPGSNHKINRTVGVMKPYNTRVGSGPPHHPDVPGLAEQGAEYGTTTGRKRRTTWLTLYDLEYAVSVAQPDEIVLTKTDILNDRRDIAVWTSPDGDYKTIGNMDNYMNFLIELFPQIKYCSDSPQGELKPI